MDFAVSIREDSILATFDDGYDDDDEREMKLTESIQ